MGIGEPRCDCLDLMIFDLGDALVGRRLRLGDALPWRRFLLAKLALGVSSPRRRLVLTLTPGVDFDFDFVNARIRDGTMLFTPQLKLNYTCWAFTEFVLESHSPIQSLIQVFLS